MTVNREIPPLEAGERAMLVAWLEFQRETLVVKCAGLTDEQLRERSVPPSSLSLLGLVRHMAEGERQWFRMVLGRQELEYRYDTDDGPDAEFDVENGKEYSLRWIMIHMIEEYARHLGHADFIRERIDGSTGI